MVRFHQRKWVTTAAEWTLKCTPCIAVMFKLHLKLLLFDWCGLWSALEVTNLLLLFIF